MNIEKEKIICPQCSIIINKIGNNNNNNLEINVEDFTKIFCEKCSNEFCFISCAYCDKYLYMKIHPKALKYNGLNGFNIQCPFKSCEKVFYFTECIKCNRTQKQKKYIKEGEIITCIYDNCKCEYIQLNCPIKECIELNSIEIKENYRNFPDGIMGIHKKEIMFQKINCFYCWRPIVFKSYKTKRNKYWECQKVKCPYEDCKKIFNRIICPFCYNEIYVSDGWYEMGSEIKCEKCKNIFSKVLCPSCGRTNICKNDHFKLGNTICGFQNCLKQNYMINCIYCRKLNFFKKEFPIKGQIIKCGYCHKTFNEILCPFCKLKNPFPLADFSFGKTYKCNYISCLKEFQYIICPNCYKYTYRENVKEGGSLKCDDCKIKFLNWQCPFCYSSIMDKNSFLKMGQMVKCPLKKCGKIYSFIRCYNCEKLIFSKENENILGNAIKCPYQGCGTYTLVIKCQYCETSIFYKNEKENYQGDNITCKKCNKEFQFIKKYEFYNNKLSYLEEIEGDTIDFGKEEVDENFLFKQDLFYDKRAKKISRLYPTQFASGDFNEKNNQAVVKIHKVLKECMVCHNNLRESIFYPCGHRCVCYNCALLLYIVNRKCPKCNKKAECIIKKVYE